MVENNVARKGNEEILFFMDRSGSRLGIRFVRVPQKENQNIICLRDLKCSEKRFPLYSANIRLRLSAEVLAILPPSKNQPKPDVAPLRQR